MSTKGTTKEQNLKGIAFITCNTFFNSLLGLFVKILRSVGLYASVLIFTYKSTLLLCVLLWGVAMRGRHLFVTKSIDLYLIRSILNTSAGLMYTYAIKGVSLPDAFALGSAIEPVLLFVASSIVCKETISSKQIGVILIGFTGAMMICMQRGVDGAFNHNYLFVLFAAFLWACNGLIVRVISRTEELETQMFYNLFFSSMLALLVCTVEGEVCSLYQIWNSPYTYHLLLISFCYLMHNITIFFSHKNAMLSYITPFFYLSFIFNMAFQYLMFQDLPSVISITGALLIIYANTKMVLLSNR